MTPELRKLFDLACRAFDHSSMDPETRHFFSEAVIVENTVSPDAMIAALEKYSVDGASIPAMPFVNFVMPAQVGQSDTPALFCLLNCRYEKLDEYQDLVPYFCFAFFADPAWVNSKDVHTLIIGSGYMGPDGVIGYSQDFNIVEYTNLEHSNFHVLLGSRVTNDMHADFVREIVVNVIGAIRTALQYIDLPTHHLIAQRDKSAGDVRPGVIPRFRDREKIILINPEEVKKVYVGVDAAPTGRTVAPHHRRGYTKLLRSSRWKHKQGQRVVVRPTWVGPESWVFNKTRYRIVRPNEPESPT